jgi:hypothetical protein
LDSLLKRKKHCATTLVHIAGRLWQVFWFTDKLYSMIFGQVMAKIRHEGGSRTFAFGPFLEVVQCGTFFGVLEGEIRKQFFPTSSLSHH